jgi:hypothetical protein
MNRFCGIKQKDENPSLFLTPLPTGLCYFFYFHFLLFGSLVKLFYFQLILKTAVSTHIDSSKVTIQLTMSTVIIRKLQTIWKWHKFSSGLQLKSHIVTIHIAVFQNVIQCNLVIVTRVLEGREGIHTYFLNEQDKRLTNATCCQI